MSDEWVLVLNCGSSSVKLALVDPGSGERRVTALAERVGTSEAVVRFRRGEEDRASTLEETSARGAVTHLLESLREDERDGLVGVGHRVVHGGDRFSESVAVDDAVLGDLHRLVDLAPLHMPANLLGIEAARDALPGLAQVAVFDTAFHQTMPPVAFRYAVPQEWYDDHQVRRYGFHGTSHRYVSARAAEVLGRPAEDLRLVTLHLGNGCSAAAVRGGESVDTTMGLTPLEGLVMGTRGGDLDPGILLHLQRRAGLGVDDLEDLLHHRAGLKGLAGTADFRDLLAAVDRGEEPARLAYAVYCRRIRKYVGAYHAVLGGADVIAFTAGVGENVARLREDSLAGLERLGVEVDPRRNRADIDGPRVVSTASSAVTVMVVPTNEELAIARQVADLLGW